MHPLAISAAAASIFGWDLANATEPEPFHRGLYYDAGYAPRRLRAEGMTKRQLKARAATKRQRAARRATRHAR